MINHKKRYELNTYFFVRVRLGRTQGRRSFLYGPYVLFEDATRLLDYIPALLLGMNANATKYTVVIEERCLENKQWTKVNTRQRLSVSEYKVITESG